MPSPNVDALVSQINKLSLLKSYGTVNHYPCTLKNASTKIVAFSDASHTTDRSQLCYLICVVYGDVAKDSTVHTLEWPSHKSRQLIRAKPAAVILAATEAIESLVPLCQIIQLALGHSFDLWLLVDSKDLYNSLTTQRNSVDKSVRGNVNCIRFVFKTKLGFMGWISGSCNPADIGTKQNSSLTDAVTLMLATGCIPVDLSSAEVKSHRKRLC